MGDWDDTEPTWEGEITIPRKEYEQLKKESRTLNKLYTGGVDNWEWCDESLQENEDND